MLKPCDFQSIQDGINFGFSHLLRLLDPNSKKLRIISNTVPLLMCLDMNSPANYRKMLGNIIGILLTEVVCKILKQMPRIANKHLFLQNQPQLAAVCLLQIFALFEVMRMEPVTMSTSPTSHQLRIHAFQQGAAFTLPGPSFTHLSGTTKLAIPGYVSALTAVTGAIPTYHHLQNGNYSAAAFSAAGVMTVLGLGLLLKQMTTLNSEQSLAIAGLALFVLAKDANESLQLLSSENK